MELSLIQNKIYEIRGQRVKCKKYTLCVMFFHLQIIELL